MRRLAARWAFASMLLAPAPAARAQSPGPVNISVDATAAGAPLQRVWAFHGYDEINDSTTLEGEALLNTLAAAHTAPVHVRSHFLLNTGDGTPALKWGSTNVYTEDAAGNPVYTWTLTDGILDALTGAGAFPFVEIGFMPEALSTHPEPYRNSSTYALDGGCFYPPADLTKWSNLIRAWAAHANGRYPDAGTRWLWELWNEPDIGYWKGTPADYDDLYDVTEAALHAVMPDAPLGGPAVAGGGGAFMRQFLQHCATGANAVTGAAGTRLDLISFHAKGGVAIAGDHVQMDLGNQLRIHRAGFAMVASFPQFQQTPVYITEADPDGCAACPASSFPEDAYRNSPAYGAYEVAMMKHSLELEAQTGVRLAGVLTWAFTFPGTPYFAGYRALATNGIELPIMGAFRLLGRLEGTRLPLTSSGALALSDLLASGVRGQPDVDGLATLNGDAVQILVWNYHDDLVPAPDTRVRLTVKVSAGFGSRVRASNLRVDDSHGDAYNIWVAQGMPTAPSREQIAALQQAMTPSPAAPDDDLAVAADGSVELTFDLPRFGISLVTLRPGDAALCASGSGCSCSVRRPPADPAGAAAAGGLVLLICLVLRRAVARRASTR
jgi:xylan 1,4-beta-xylosidase